MRNAMLHERLLDILLLIGYESPERSIPTRLVKSPVCRLFRSGPSRYSAQVGLRRFEGPPEIGTDGNVRTYEGTFVF
jgi:hypothetical protein